MWHTFLVFGFWFGGRGAVSLHHALRCRARRYRDRSVAVIVAGPKAPSQARQAVSGPVLTLQLRGGLLLP